MLDWKLSKLQVSNFRNLSSDVLDFSPGINCIFGENGNGKTNILEAIYVLITRKSFRKNAAFPQYLGIDGERSEIYLTSLFKDEEEQDQAFSTKLTELGNQWFLNNQPHKPKLKLGVVFINPFDSHSFHLSASERRSWFDRHIGLIDPYYKKVLKNYQSALRFRNNLLSKKPPHYQEQLKAIDIEFSKTSLELTKLRKDFLTKINPFLSQTFKELFSIEHKLEISLETRIHQNNEKDVMSYFRERHPKDDAASITTYGVHKDDYILSFDGFNSLDFCSLGQQKMSFLSLLFSFISLFRHLHQAYPIVLIDDVSGELDEKRWSNLVSYLEDHDFQVFITTANSRFEKELDKIKNSKRIKVDQGDFNSLDSD